MPRILRIANRLNLGGPTYNVAQLSRFLAPEFETRLLSGMKDESEAGTEHIIEGLGLKPVYIPEMHRALNPKQDLAALKFIRREIREFKPDIVHTHAAKAGTLGRLAAWLEGVPVVVHTFHGHVFHSYFGPLKTRFFLEIERFLAKKSTAIIAISEAQRTELVDQFRIASKEKFHVVPLGFDLDPFQLDQDDKRRNMRKTWGLQEEDVAIGIIGRLVPIKDHLTFLKALKAMKARPKGRIVAFVVGDGELGEALREQVGQLGLSAGNGSGIEVVFTSWITKVDEALSALDVVALSSLNEGTPVSLIEAQAAAKAVVSTDVGGVSDTVLANTSGLLVPAQDANAMADALDRLVQDPALRHQMGIAGREHAIRRFHRDRLLGEMRELYHALLP